MKIVFDTCILYPTFLRKVLLRIATRKLFLPVWSNSILDEWRYVVSKLGSVQKDQVGSEIALLKHQWAESLFLIESSKIDDLWLPDLNDVHVLATAIISKSDIILTLNNKDFPKSILSKYSIGRFTPDELLKQLWREYPDVISNEIIEAYNTLVNETNLDLSLKRVLKKANLPGIGKLILK